jgi:hypothetical protein
VAVRVGVIVGVGVGVAPVAVGVGVGTVEVGVALGIGAGVLLELLPVHPPTATRSDTRMRHETPAFACLTSSQTISDMPASTN